VTGGWEPVREQSVSTSTMFLEISDIQFTL
jgi:hypothetical protein